MPSSASAVGTGSLGAVDATSAAAEAGNKRAQLALDIQLGLFLHPLVKSLGDDVVRAQLLGTDEVRQSLGGGHLHLLVDVPGPGVEGAAENARKCQDIVDLVGEITAARGHHRRAAGLGVLGEDLRGGVSAGEDDGVPVHGPDHLRGDSARGGDADEHIRPRQHIGQRAGALLQVGDLGHLLLDPVEPLPAGVDGALPVAHSDVPEAGGEQELHDGHGGGSRAGGDHPDVLLGLAHHLQGVGESGQGDDGGAVLVVVEDGDVAALLQLALDLKAPGGGDVLQVDAPEGAGNIVDRLDKRVHILGLYAQRKCVHAAEALEQHALALHHGHTSLRADVPQAQHGGAVGDDSA